MYSALALLAGCYLSALKQEDPVPRDCETRTAYYQDADGDGYGNDLSVVMGCSAEDGWVEAAGDCDDTDPARASDCTQDTGSDTGADTSGADTAGADTSGADTAGADTGGADTAGADTAGADTAGADTAAADTATDTGAPPPAASRGAGESCVSCPPGQRC